MTADVDIPARPDAMTYYVEPDDPFDKFPWTFSAYSKEFQDDSGQLRGSISTPNGKRPDGTQHTYWSVVGDVWEPVAVIICKAVNAEAHARYGTPDPPSVYTDEWRLSLLGGSCDWGDCDRPAVVARFTDTHGYLPVCRRHQSEVQS